MQIVCRLLVNRWWDPTFYWMVIIIIHSVIYRKIHVSNERTKTNELSNTTSFHLRVIAMQTLLYFSELGNGIILYSSYYLWFVGWSGEGIVCLRPGFKSFLKHQNVCCSLSILWYRQYEASFYLLQFYWYAYLCKLFCYKVNAMYWK